MASVCSSIIKYRGKITTVGVMLMTLFGILNKPTKPMLSVFLSMNYGQITDEADQSVWKTNYGIGLIDLVNVYLWLLVYIPVKSIIQDNILNKLHRKFQLSKSGRAKFYEAGQLIVFNAASIIWTLAVIITENWFTDFSLLLNGHQQITMSFLEKLFYLNQLAYWVLAIPELYFQKVKKKDIFARVKFSVLNLAFILNIYVSNFHCVGISVLLLHNISEFIKHAFKLIDNVKGEIKRAQPRSVYRWLFFVIQSLILVLPQATVMYNDVNGMELGGELLDFLRNTLHLVGAFIIQFWIIYEFSGEQKPSGFKISKLLCFTKSKDKAETIIDSSNKKRKNAAHQKIDEPTEVNSKIKEALKNGVKKTPKK